MTIAPHDNSAVDPKGDFSVAEIFAVRGMNTNDSPMSLNTEEMTVFNNFELGPRYIRRRPGSALLGTDPGSITKVIGLGHLEQDSGNTLLFLGNNGDLYKYSSGSWSVSDKTNYDITNDANIVTFTSKSGASLESGTSTSGTTKYIIEDSSKTWVPGAYKNRCVVIRGETKFILDNTVTTLYLSDRLNRDTDSDYQTQAYNIYAVSPFAFIANGVDYVQKYNLTTHVPLDGTHVTSGEALSLFRYLAQHQGRLWAARGIANDNDRVFISDQAIGEQFTKDTNLNVNLALLNDGDEVTGIASLPLREGSVLLVTKNESVHSVEGTTVLDYAVHARFSKSGCIAPKTLKVSGRSAFMLGFDGVLRFSGDGTSDLLQKPIPISEPIKGDLDDFSEAQKRAACAEVWNNKYHLCIGTSMYVYDIVESIRREQHIWSKYTFPWSFHVLHAMGNSLYGGSATSGQVYQLFTTDNDDSDARIFATLETPWITFPGAPTGILDRVELMVDPDEAEDECVFRIAVAVDGGSYGTWITATIDEALGVYKFLIKETGTMFKIKLLDNFEDDPLRIAMPIRLFYSIGSFGPRDTKADLAI